MTAGQAVAIMLPTCIEYFHCFVGVMLAGGIPVPIYPPARLSQMEDHIRRHARILANGGWTKDSVRQFLYENYGKRVGDLRRFGKVIELESEPNDKFIHSARSPETLLIVVAGASNAGVSTVAMSFSWRQGHAVVEEA